jgi:hypothetical protein
MYPGAIYIAECPKCKQEISLPSYSSGNTFDQEYWSDGKKVTPSLWCEPWLAKCPFCLGCIWLDEAKTLGKKVEYINFPKKSKRRSLGVNSRPFEYPSEADFFNILYENLPRDKEEYIRFQIWWMANDKYRKPDCKDPVSFSPEQRANMRALSNHFDNDGLMRRLLKVEICRELGEFWPASDLIWDINQEVIFSEKLYDHELNKMLDMQRKALLKKERQVIRYF